MLNYFILFILLISNLFSDQKGRKENVLLFHLASEIEPLNIIQSDTSLIDLLPLNTFLMNHGGYKIEKWSKFASKDDVYNGIQFSKI